MKRVLIADPHNAFRQSLTVVLEQQASLETVLQAASLIEVRRVLPSMDGISNLAIVSLDLPDGDATPLIEDLRATGIPVLALAFEPGQKRRAQALQAGANEVLSIASSCENLVAVATRLVEG
jgi:DNA-binding NarL/FixJ family response regulator